jgi:hypothetical protein
MIETMTRQEIEAFFENGWCIYDSESVDYDYSLVRRVDGYTLTRHIKIASKDKIEKDL